MSMPTMHLAEQYFQPKIDLIQHLIQYSQNILLITAPARGGKTAFAHFCLAHPTPQLKKHLLVITATLSVETMMENIAKGFGMSWPQNGPLSSEAVQKIWTLFVEDAQLLSLDMLEALVRLVNFHQEPRRQLHLVLLGEDKLVDQFSQNRITNLVGSYSTVIELALPSNWRQSYTQQFSHPVLVKAETPLFDSVKPKSTIAPPEFGSSTSRDFEDPITSGFSPDPIAETDIDLLDELSDDWSQAQGKTQSTGAERYKHKHLFSHPVAYGLYLGAIVGVGLWSWQAKEVPQFVPESEEMVALSTPAPASTLSKKRSYVQAEPLVIAASESETESERELEMHELPPFVQAAPKPVLKVKEAKAVPTKLATVNINKEPLEKNHPKVKLVKQADKRVAPKPESLHKTVEKTILAKNKHHYTVQLYGSNEPEKVVNFKQAHGLDKAWVVEKKHQGKTWHVLVMGDYPTKTQAEKATEHLPNSLYHAKVKPWVREFASLQDEIVNSNKKG